MTKLFMKRTFSLMLTVLCIATFLCVPNTQVSAKNTNIYLSISSKTTAVGQKFKIYAKSSIKSKFKWTLSKSKIVKISKSVSKSGEKITVTCKKLGSVKLKATALDSSKLNLTCKIKVSKKPKLSAKILNMNNSLTRKLYVSGGSGKIKWSSTNKSVAKVSSTGLVTAYKAGSCYIKAKRNGITMKCKVKVSKFYTNLNLADVYDFGALNGVLVSSCKSKITDSGNMYHDIIYNLGNKDVATAIAKYENKLVTKGFYFDNQTTYSYGVTDYFYKRYADAASTLMQVSIIDLGNSMVSVGIMYTM